MAAGVVGVAFPVTVYPLKVFPNISFQRDFSNDVKFQAASAVTSPPLSEIQGKRLITSTAATIAEITLINVLYFINDFVDFTLSTSFQIKSHFMTF